MSIFLTILIALITGLIGALVSSWIYIRRDNRMFKVQTLKKFAANRYHLMGDKFTEALNEIFVVFNDSKDVINELENFHEIVVSGRAEGLRKKALINLFKAMCRDTNIKYRDLDDSFFLTPFNATLGEDRDG